MKYYQFIGALAVAGIFAVLGPAAAEKHGKSDPAIDGGALESACATAAAAEPSAVRSGKTTKMWCAVVDREGQSLAINATDTGGTPDKPAGSDAWRGSIEIALAKAYTAVAFSSNDQALDTRGLGLASRPDTPGTVPADVGHDDGPAPLWGIGNSNPYRSVLGTGNKDDSVGPSHHGIITFAGGQPVYTCTGTHSLIGAVGVSGDGVDEDDTVAKNTVTGAGYCLHP